MTLSSKQDYTQLLQQLMQRLGFASYRQLSRSAGVSEKQLRRLRKGEVSLIRVETLLKLSQALQVSASELLASFSLESTIPASQVAEDEVKALRQEYQRLQAKLEQQQETLRQEFQQSSLQTLESWLLQWSRAAHAAQQNPQLPAVKLVPLVRPVEQLLQEWGVEAIASIGCELPYDPQWHQLRDGTAQPGEPVRVRYTGYRWNKKLLYRAEVSPVVNIS